MLRFFFDGNLVGWLLALLRVIVWQVLLVLVITAFRKEKQETDS